MTVPAASRSALRYHGLFPDWAGARPVSWFFGEQLLEARSESNYPTNAGGDDEAVNVYLVGLLGAWVAGDPRVGILPGREPLLLPPDPGQSRATRAEHYRRQADHRLLALGVFDRGDLVRRRRLGWGLDEPETRARDLADAQSCYQFAADLEAGRAAARPGLVAVWRRLSDRLPDYAQVLQTLARRRFGLGARLTEAQLHGLLNRS